MKKHLQAHRSLKFVIAGGGTGGHVFPAIAIARALKKQAGDARILFVGARGRLEMTKVPEAGFHIIGLEMAGLQRRLSWKNLLLPFKLAKSLGGSKAIVKRFRPDVVIGVGGYVSGPVLWAAAGQHIPVMIQEQNSYPGLTNRILAKKAARICVAYEGMERYFPKEKIYLTGNPVRQEVTDTGGKHQEALDHFGLSATRPVLLVTGGSLGATTINQSIHAGLQFFVRKGIQLIWQTGKAYAPTAQKAAAATGDKGIRVLPFIDRMDYAYAAAGVVVSRAGAIAVSEIAAVKKPAILIPSPNVAEDHQTKNALALVNHHAAILVRDEEAIDRLVEVAAELVFDEEKKHRLREKIAGMSYLNAADAIAGMALGLVGKGK